MTATARRAYHRQGDSAWTRIDLLLALYDGAIQRLGEALDRDGAASARSLLRAQRIVVELLAGLDLSHGEVPKNLQRLYAFVLEALANGARDRLIAAQDVLQTLREGLHAIRDEAVTLERSGILATPDVGRTLHAVG